MSYTIIPKQISNFSETDCGFKLTGVFITYWIPKL